MLRSVRQFVFWGVLAVAMTNRLGAQGTAFTYQGRLNDGPNPANGYYDFTFTVYDAPTNGDITGMTLTNSAVAVSNGLFTATLDFGGTPFVGNPQWLGMEVRSNSTGTFTELWPRQPLTPTPYAIMAGSASNLLGALPASQLSGAVSLTQLPATVITEGENGVILGGTFYGTLADLDTQFPTTLSNLNSQVATPLNLGGGTNINASQITGGTWTNASLNGGTWVNAKVNYAYQSFSTNYTITPTDVVLDCTGTNQVITLLPANEFPPSTLLTIWSDNVNGSVLITNATGYEAITVPGAGQGLAVLLGPANSPSNCVTLMVHGGHW